MKRLAHLAAVLLVLTMCRLVAAADPLHPPFYVVEVDLRPGKAIYVTVLRPDVVFSSGMPPEAIVGQLLDGSKEVAPQNFARNRVFVEYLHSFIDMEARQEPLLQAEARKIGNGKLVVADRRGTIHAPSGEDNFGVFEVSNGTIGSYTRNEAHRILSERGLFRLPNSLERQLIAELERRAKAVK